MKTHTQNLTTPELLIYKIIMKHSNGEDNPISKKELIRLFEEKSTLRFEERQYRRMIRNVVICKNGFRMIGSSSKGYWACQKGEDGNKAIRKQTYSLIERLLANGGATEWEDLIKFVGSKKKTLDKPSQGQKRIVFGKERDEVDYFAPPTLNDFNLKGVEVYAKE